MSGLHEHKRLEDALRGLYQASAQLAVYAGDSDAAQRAVRDAEWGLERSVEVLTRGIEEEPSNAMSMRFRRNDVAAARRALDAAIQHMIDQSENMRPEDRELNLLREELNDIAGRLAAIVTRHRYEATSHR